MNNKMESFIYATLGCIVNAIDKIGHEKYYLYFNIMYLIICIYIIWICNTNVHLGA